MLLLLPGYPSVVASGDDTIHGSMSQRAHTGRTRGRWKRAERERKRVRAFLKRDSRTSADTPHPQILHHALPLPHSLSLSFSLTLLQLPILLSRSLARSRACALSRAFLFFLSLFRPYTPSRRRRRRRLLSRRDHSCSTVRFSVREKAR